MNAARKPIPACRRRGARHRRLLLALVVALATVVLAAGVDAPGSAQAPSLMVAPG